MAPIGYRKHWAKGMCHSKPDYIISPFPQVDQFIKLMAELDPNGKFCNEHITLWLENIKVSLERKEQEEQEA
jgi:hypothetical protein